MSIYEVIVLAVALALDAMLVCFSFGLIIKERKMYNALCLSLSFGFFQFIMPLLGWKLTGYIYNYLEIYSKWIVFTVFLILGLKFLKEEETKIKCISFSCIMILAVATSIDAFGAGVSIRFLNSDIMLPALLIGMITFILSMSGFFAAGMFCKFPARYVEITGAVFLIYLAIKSLNIF